MKTPLFPLHNLYNLETLKKLLHDWESGEDGSLSLTGFLNAGWGLFLAALIKLQERRVVVVTATEKEARQLEQDTSFFYSAFFSDAEGETQAAGLPDIMEEPAYLVGSVEVFPTWDTLPFEDLSPGHEVVARRVALLFDMLVKRRCRILIIPIESFIQYTLSPDRFLEHCITFEIYQQVNPDDLKSLFINLGYRPVNRVEEPGEFGSRGGIIDIFIPVYRRPVRLEFFGDELSDIREFDPVTQRSSEKIFQFTLCPAKEILIKQHIFDACIESIRSKQDLHGFEDPLIEDIIEKFHVTTDFEGIERWFPFLLDSKSTVLDFAGEDTLLTVREPDLIFESMRKFQDTAEFEHRKCLRMEVPLPDVDEAYMPEPLYDELLKSKRVLELEEFVPARDSSERSGVYRMENKLVPSFIRKPKELFTVITEGLSRNEHIFLCCHSRDQATDLENQFMSLESESIIGQKPAVLLAGSSSNKTGQVNILVGDISGGFRVPDLNLTIISAVELFGEKRVIKQKQRKISSESFSSIQDLKPGDFIVHVHHGIGRYMGIQLINAMGYEKDFLAIEYADKDKLYVPIDRLNLVQRYLRGEDHNPTLDKLGGKNWEKVKTRIKKAMRDMAEELLKLYAQRTLAESNVYSVDGTWQRQLEAGFEFVETDDQLNSIHEVKHDMESGKLMDRLICGDVGFGKTEVAIRAAFKAINDGKQVAVLVPTTILAYQHYKTFAKRFEQFPVQVEMLSRFRKPKEQKLVAEGLQKGTVDLVVGTHRILSKDVDFKELGLLIIDEEHRFGVAQKEKIKKLKHSVDILTMTATPIPRTLHMSLMGMRDISLVNTPPKDRLAIHTQIIKFDPDIIREVILREMSRGGQIYFVHNRVQSILTIGDYLKEWVPEARTAIAHGQMEEKQLETIMIKFMEKEYDVLLCTAIIESGLDIPNVNTILINRADKFGLAQLYQLRGRVGRDRYQAYAYLLVPDKRTLTTLAKRRLRAIQELTELGSGFRLATYDMDIRGTGNLLGKEQHGHIKALGFDLYCQLLEETVKELKGEPVEPELDPMLNLPFDAYIPKRYIRDITQRLMTYRKIAGIKSPDDQADLESELVDRYGKIPDPTINLFHIMDLKRICRSLKIESLDMKGDDLVIVFTHAEQFDPDKFKQYLVRKTPRLRAASPKKMFYRIGPVKGQDLIDNVMVVLNDFTAMKEPHPASN